jgi:hypothetical protein
MASELEITNSVESPASSKTMENNIHSQNNDSTNTYSDYDGDEGEWELAGAKSMLKKSSTTQNFTQNSPKSNRRRRRLNSSSSNKRSSKTNVLSKSKSNHVELSNLVNNNTVNSNNKALLDKSNDVTITNNDKVNDSPQIDLKTPNDNDQVPQTSPVLQLNPWAKVPDVKPVSIDIKHEKNTELDTKIITSTHNTNTSLTNNVTNSTTLPNDLGSMNSQINQTNNISSKNLSNHNQNSLTSPNSSSSSSSSSNSSSGMNGNISPYLSTNLPKPPVQANLDTEDWPSLNDELTYSSLNHITNSKTTKKPKSPLSSSQSCTFNQETKSSLEHTTCLQTPPQTPPTNNNINTMSETPDKESENTGKSPLESQKDSASNIKTQSSSKPKWKPLVIDAPKRERKSYKSSGGPRSYRGGNSNSHTSNNDINTSNENTENNVIPPHAGGSNKRNYRAKSLDRQNNNQDNNNQQNNTNHLSNNDEKTSLPVDISTENNDNFSNRSNSSKTYSPSKSGKMNKSFNDTSSNSNNYQSQRHHSTNSVNKNNSDFQGISPQEGQFQRPLRFDRATAQAKAYRNNQNQYSSLPVQQRNGQNIQKMTGLKRENHKDYLYGEDAIIVEEVPVLLPVHTPNDMYHQNKPQNDMYHQSVMPIIIQHQGINQQSGSINMHPHPIYNTQISNESLNSLNHTQQAAPQPHGQQPGIFYNTSIWTEDQIKEYVRHQIEYYFSIENLEKDLFLRKKMDILGYIPLSVISSFNRVKSLSSNFSLIVIALAQSKSLELTPVYDQLTGKIIENYLVRCKVNPTKWPLQNLAPQNISPVNDNSHLNPNVAAFVPRFGDEEKPKQKVSLEVKKSNPVSMTKPSFERMLSSSVPDKEPSPWLTVQSKKDKLKTKKEKNIEIPSSSDTTISATTKKDNREDFDFMFDEEIASTSKSSQKKITVDFSASESEESDYDYDEMDDQDISKLVIITQTPPSNRKATHLVHDKDRTGVHTSRSKITSQLAQAIDDGLYYYEQDLKTPKNTSSSLFNKQVELVSQEEFNKLKSSLDSDKDKEVKNSTKKIINIPVKSTDKKIGKNFTIISSS